MDEAKLKHSKIWSKFNKTNTKLITILNDKIATIIHNQEDYIRIEDLSQII